MDVDANTQKRQAYVTAGISVTIFIIIASVVTIALCRKRVAVVEMVATMKRIM